MKKWAFNELYQNFICIYEHKKVPDKVFCFRIAFSVVSIIACLTVMLSSAFALFCSEVSTDNSILTGAYYYVTVDGAENGTYICPLVSEDEHIFEIKAGGTATTGFCKVEIEDEVYYTDVIHKGKSIVLTVYAAEDTIIRFTPKLGKPVSYGISNTFNIIDHSHTPITEEASEEDGETDESSLTVESGDLQSESSADASNETSSDETDFSLGEIDTSSSNSESSDSSESSCNSIGGSSTEDTTSNAGNTTDSGSSSESSGAPVQSGGNDGSSSSSADGGSSSGGGESSSPSSSSEGSAE